ncbi:MAG TPA: hypothetical protein DIU35_05505 [Candidatus Latescibacteria bacterium]|nr:hypothetical protein [Gemmatimonadota bacterium]HCR16920.1 hypothetical protein [Candidatus Latescibacterota bacterium]
MVPRTSGIIALAALVSIIQSCGTKPLELDADDLTNMLSVSNVVKQPVADPSDASRISRVIIDVDVIHVGDFVIDVPFTMTWGLRDQDGNLIGSASAMLAEKMAPGDRRHVTLSISFPPRASLSDLQDALTFDPLPKSQ